MATTQTQDQVDPVFEFEAPRYIDFATSVENQSEDTWFDVQKSSAEELKTTDLLETNNNEDFGTSTAEGATEPATKKRTEDTSFFDHRPPKKHRVHHHPVQTIPLTVPESPCFATKSRLRGTICESEDDMQCRYMAAMLVEQAKRRRLNSFYKKKALYSSGAYMPTRSTKPLTEPQEVHFHSDSRLRAVPVEEQPKREPVIEKNESGLTVPRPFQFHTDYRVKPEPVEPVKTSPFKSFKQKMIEIQKKTPKRFRTLPRNTLWLQRSPQSPVKLGVTIPQEFNFETWDRSRPTHVISAEEREELEMQNMPKFKALPLDPKVLNSGGQFGISRAPKVPLTAPVTPKFATSERAVKREAQIEEEQEEEPVQQFKARDLDRTIFGGPIKGVPPPPPKQVTIPESPCLATKGRSIFHPPAAAPKEEPFVFKARPIPLSEPFVPEKSEHKLEVQPFQLQTDYRGTVATKKMSERLQKQKKREKKQREFKAQPMPIADRPEPQGFAFAPPVTIPQPFFLQSEIRGEQAVQKFQQQVQEEEKEVKEMALFKAHPIPDAPPFQPQKSQRALTVISDFTLNSDVRSVERKKFEIQKTEKSKAAEEARKLQEEDRKLEEERFIKQMRKTMVHKPMPILPSKPIHIQPSSIPLTSPHTPLLRTRQRSTAHSGRDL